MNEDLLGMVRANVREPVQVVGDIYALVACNEKGGTRLVEMMREFKLRDLENLGEEIITRSRRAMSDVIGKLPQGSWSASMTIDGFEAPVTLAATLTIAGDRVLVDYTGTSGLSRYAINCPICYTDAYTAFGVKAALAPWIPNNTGTLDAVIVTAPENTIVNAPHPAAVYARSVIGHMLPDVVYGCLHQAMPDTVPAEGTSSLWNLSLLAGHGLTGSEGSAVRAFNVTTFHSGGAGARPRQDGLSATPFPSGVRNVPVEITEAITPLVIWRKEYRKDSGGAGRQRGGLGQRMEIENRDPAAFGIQARFERGVFPARGRAGGGPGGLGKLSLASGTQFNLKGFQVIPAGDRLIVEMPGGGGYGDPFERDPVQVARDVRYGLIDVEQASLDYGVVLDAAGEVEEGATAARRSERG
jgi:N-methylhydantoinase B